MEQPPLFPTLFPEPSTPLPFFPSEPLSPLPITPPGSFTDGPTSSQSDLPSTDGLHFAPGTQAFLTVSEPLSPLPFSLENSAAFVDSMLNMDALSSELASSSEKPNSKKENASEHLT